MAIEFTELAARKFKRILQQQGVPQQTSLRMSIKGGGCGGFTYRLDLADKPLESDHLFCSHGLQIICDPKSYLYLDGTVIDFRDELKFMGRGFVFNNPHARQTCPCGASFGI